MKIIELLFVFAIIVSNLLPEITTAQPPVPNGCVSSGLTHCCTLDTCVTLGGCYCDQGCYDTSDCCEDIHQTCPPTDGDGGSGESPTLDPEASRPPSITMAPEDNVTIPTAHPHALTMLVGYDRGNPLCTLVWRKDGEIVTPRRNPRVSVMSSGGISIRSVSSSDRGLYTVTVSNAVGSDSASFKLFTKFARLIESEYREGSFICEAKGYPIAHFVGWRAMNGSSITDTELTYLSSGTSEFESTIIASLPLHAVNCTSGGGISCVFDNGNGSYRVESPMMDCPTIIDVKFEESEYSINEQAVDNQYVALRVCLRLTVTDNGLIPDTDTFTVTVATRGGTAIAGSDFVAMSVDRTFSLPLEQSDAQCECLSIIRDDIAEGDEVFYLALTSTHPQVLTTGAVVHIIDDDAVIASLERTEYFVSESEGCLEVCVRLVGRYQSSITVYLCIEGINATANEDYTGHNMAVPVTFQTSSLQSPEMRGRACTSLEILNDTDIEGNETLRVQIEPDYNDKSVKIGDQSSAIVTIIDDDAVPLTATLVNDTPRVEGRMVTINFRLDGGSPAERNALRCRITGPGRTPTVVIENCNSGVVVEELTFRKQQFNFFLEYTVDGENVTLLQRDFRLDSDVCWLHLINQGVSVNGSSATFEWRPSGPSRNNKTTSFQCQRLKGLIRIRENCSSPYTWTDLSPGKHRLIVEPYQTPNCRRLESRRIYFTI